MPSENEVELLVPSDGDAPAFSVPPIDPTRPIDAQIAAMTDLARANGARLWHYRQGRWTELTQAARQT